MPRTPLPSPTSTPPTPCPPTPPTATRSVSRSGPPGPCPRPRPRPHAPIGTAANTRAVWLPPPQDAKEWIKRCRMSVAQNGCSAPCAPIPSGSSAAFLQHRCGVSIFYNSAILCPRPTHAFLNPPLLCRRRISGSPETFLRRMYGAADARNIPPHCRPASNVFFSNQVPWPLLPFFSPLLLPSLLCSPTLLLHSLCSPPPIPPAPFPATCLQKEEVVAPALNQGGLHPIGGSAQSPPRVPLRHPRSQRPGLPLFGPKWYSRQRHFPQRLSFVFCVIASESKAILFRPQSSEVENRSYVSFWVRYGSLRCCDKISVFPKEAG